MQQPTTTTTAAAAAPLQGATGTVPATPNTKLYERAGRAVVSIRVSSGGQTGSVDSGTAVRWRGRVH